MDPMSAMHRDGVTARTVSLARLPSFGRRLVDLRERGDDPPRVWVLAGDDWRRRPHGAPMLAIRSHEDPRRLDWSIVRRIPVHVVGRGHPALSAVAGAIAWHGAPTVVHWLADEIDAWPDEPGRQQADVASIARGERVLARGVWPSWWSDALELDYADRLRAYCAELLARAEARAAGASLGEHVDVGDQRGGAL